MEMEVRMGAVNGTGAKNGRMTFSGFARGAARWSGSSWAFLGASVMIVGWLVTGPVFRFSDTWQLVINTGTTIITFLMVFLIQNTQNRDAEAMHIKLDELIRAIKGAQNRLINLENLEDEELDRIRGEYAELAEEAKEAMERRRGKK
jgi:low affinity Fe/Cu permease